MSGELKSSTQATEGHGTAIRTQADFISEIGSVEDILTNLAVMDNIQCVINHINACVNDYKNLSYEDVDAILAVNACHMNKDREQVGQMSKREE